jgi:hypothetical protein
MGLYGELGMVVTEESRGINGCLLQLCFSIKSPHRILAMDTRVKKLIDQDAKY